jgi:hypothetical protein
MCLMQQPVTVPDASPPKVTPPAKSPENAGQLATNDVARRRGLMGAAQNVSTTGMGLTGQAGTTNANMSAFKALTGTSYLG